MPFQSDDQRKAVMSKLGNHGPSSSSVKSGTASSSNSGPKNKMLSNNDYGKKFDSLSGKEKKDMMAALWNIRSRDVDLTGYKYSFFAKEEKKEINAMIDALEKSPYKGKRDWFGNSNKNDSEIYQESCVRCGTKDLPCNCGIHDGNWFDNLLDELEPKKGETSKELYARIEPIVEKLQNVNEVQSNEGASLYLSDFLNDLEEPNAAPGEYDDGAKTENYLFDLNRFKEEMKKPITQ